MSRMGRMLSPCRIAAAVALALLLAACPSGVTFKRAGPCGRSLCECSVPAQHGGEGASPCCLLRMQVGSRNLDAPAAHSAAPRLALEEGFPPCTPGTLPECALLGAEHEVAAVALAVARPEPSYEIPTPPPRS